MTEAGEMDQLARELRSLSDVELARELQRRYPKPIQVTKGTLLLVTVQLGRALHERDATIEKLERRLEAIEQKNTSFGHRLDRHANHLSSVETRTKKLETK